MKVITAIAEKKPVELGTTIRQYVRPAAEPVDPGGLLQLLGEAEEVLPEEEAVKPLNRPGTIRPCRLETQPSDDTRTKLGTKVTALGIIRVASTA